MSGLYQILKDLQIDVVTEGIETAEQLKFVADHSQSKLQGFYLNKPQGSEAMEKELLFNKQSKIG